MRGKKFNEAQSATPWGEWGWTLADRYYCVASNAPPLRAPPVKAILAPFS